VSRPGGAALIGKRGWLFPCEGSDAAHELPSSGTSATVEQLERRCEELGERRRRLQALGIPYVFAVAPRKERVYERLLPDGISAGPDRLVRRANALLRHRNDGEMLDLLPILRTGRRIARVFPRTDSEWSDRGAFFAYRQLMSEAGKRLIDLGEPLLPEEGRFLRREGFRGDLAAKPKLALAAGRLSPAGESDAAWEEEIEVADLSVLRSLRMPAPEHLEVTPGHAPRLYEIAGAPELPRAVLVGDTSCLGLIPWLAEHFRRFVFLRSVELPLDAIELEMPDVVIHVLSERSLASAP
jgi:alginate O-acetyltransferase complex protein AlgJ